jgi:hypothetical protein
MDANLMHFFERKLGEIADFVLINREDETRPKPNEKQKKLYNYSSKLVISLKCFAPAKIQHLASSLIFSTSCPL